MPDTFPVEERLARNLERVRKVKSLTRAQLADLSGVDPSTIYAIERRRYKDARVSTVSALAEAMEVPLGTLLD
jgi:transcriptional regulator with XRE-family HTH domain